MTTPRQQATVAQKLAVLQLVAKIGVKPAAREAKVPLSTLKSWRKDADLLKQFAMQHGVETKNRHRLAGGGRKSSLTESVEKQLLEYIEENFKLDNRVTIQMLVTHAQSLDATLNSVDEKILKRRIWRILHRNNIGIHQSTPIA